MINVNKVFHIISHNGFGAQEIVKTEKERYCQYHYKYLLCRFHKSSPQTKCIFSDALKQPSQASRPVPEKFLSPGLLPFEFFLQKI